MGSRTASTPARVLGYCRVSSYDQGAHGTSLEAQREEIERYCAKHGYPAPIFFIEVEGGGSEKIERRVEVARLMASVTKGDLVLVAKQDRWSRHTLFYLQSVEAILASGARFFSLAEAFDPSTPEGKFAAGLMAQVAELEHGRIRDRTVGARKRLRARGAWVEGPPPYGYRVEGRKLVLDEKAATMRTAFVECAQGRTTRDLAARYGDDAGAWARRLRDRRYLGQMRPVARKGVRARPGDVWIDSHEPLIDRVTWQAAQDALDERKMTRTPGTESATLAFLLRSLPALVCGDCGGRLRAHAPEPTSSTKHGGWYFCFAKCGGRSLWARHVEVDAFVEAAMLERLSALRDHLTVPVVDGADVPDWQKRRAAESSKRARLVQAIAKGVISDDDARATMIEIDARLEQIDRDEATWAEEHATPKERREMLKTVDGLRSSWSKLTIDEKREVIGEHAKRIAIYRTAAVKWQRVGRWRIAIEWKMML